MKTFELTYYDDLFKEKNDKITFWFILSTIKLGLGNRFTIYLFYKNIFWIIIWYKLIIVYNNIIENMEYNKENEGKINIIKLLVIIAFIIVITILGFLHWKKIYFNEKKTKINWKRIEKRIL